MVYDNTHIVIMMDRDVMDRHVVMQQRDMVVDRLMVDRDVMNRDVVDRYRVVGPAGRVQLLMRDRGVVHVVVVVEWEDRLGG